MAGFRAWCFGWGGREMLDRGVHERFDPKAVDGADGIGSIKAEGSEVSGGRLGEVGIDFVDGDEDGLPAFAQAVGDVEVERDEAILHIDDEDDEVGGFDGEFDLFKGGAGDDVAGFFAAEEADAAGVHKGKGMPAPLGFGGYSIASDAGLIMHDGNTTTDDAVKERGLADVGPSDDGD